MWYVVVVLDLKRDRVRIKFLQVLFRQSVRRMHIKQVRSRVRRLLLSLDRFGEGTELLDALRGNIAGYAALQPQRSL